MRPHARVREPRLSCLPPQTNGVLLIVTARLRQGARLDEVLEGEDRVALVHLRVVDHRHDRVETALADVEDSPHVRLDVLARQNVRWDCCCSRGDRCGLMTLFVQMHRFLWMRWKAYPPRSVIVLGQERRHVKPERLRDCVKDSVARRAARLRASKGATKTSAPRS